MTVDGVVGRSLSTTTPGPTVSYVDTDIDPINITTSQGVYRILEPLLGAGGLLRTLPQICKVVAQNSSNTPQYYYKFMVDKVVLNLNLVGSNANIVSVADLYNRIRTNVWESNYPYSSVNYPVFDIDNQIDWKYVQKHKFDHVAALSATAYDSTTAYPAPATTNIRVSIPIGRVFEAISTTTTGGLPTSFDTTMGNLLLSLVSDSSVNPHPSASGSIRMYYRQMNY